MHFANIQMGNFIWGRVYGLGKIGRGKVYDSLPEYSPLPKHFGAIQTNLKGMQLKIDKICLDQ